jgi:hypothetical protein
MPKIGEIGDPKLLGYKGWAKQIWCACPECGRQRWVQLTKLRQRGPKLCKKCSNRAKADALRGSQALNWKGGRYSCPRTGYVFIWLAPEDPLYCMATTNSYAREHRVVMARHLGRPLEATEHVHHKNGKKDDNRLDNLDLLSPSQHILDHSKGYQEGFRKGYADGGHARIRALETRVRELEARLCITSPGTLWPSDNHGAMPS